MKTILGKGISKGTAARFFPRLGAAILLVLWASAFAIAQEGDLPGRLKYNGGPGTRDLMLQDYAEKTARTLLRDPKLPQANIVLESQTELTLDEYLEAIERALRMHGIAMVPVGKKFLKVVPVSKRPVQEGMAIRETLDPTPLEERGKLVTQMISLKHITIPEAVKAITPFKHEYALIHPLERSNSLLVTDTGASINRIVQIIRQIDQPPEIREEPHVRVVLHAKASDIKKKLEEIIKEAQAELAGPKKVVQTKSSGQPGFTARTIPGVIRASSPRRKAVVTTAAAVIDELVQDAEKGVIHGRVQIIADDRTNTLIIITRPENMKFFNKIIDVLDISMDPDVVVKVQRLEFADSETVAKMLNDLIGEGSKDDIKVAPDAGKDGALKGAALNQYVANRQAAAVARATKAAGKETKVGELSSANIKILANKRTNSLIVMASKQDMGAIESIIKEMDMRLSQVLIEAVILEVGLDNDIQTGVDWVQRAMISYDESKKGASRAIGAYAGGAGGGTLAPLNTVSLLSTSQLKQSMPTGHGLTYYFTHFGLSLDVVLSMSSSDSRSKIISSPVIVTHDNTEAKVEASKERYFFKGKRWVYDSNQGGHYEDDVESRKVKISLAVTPHINEKRLVVMDVHQTVEELGVPQLIGENEWPTMLTRDMTASIAVNDRETIVLGGLVKREEGTVNKGVPFLRSIPFLGALFRFKRKESSRSEIVVFITPYILDTQESIEAESRRIKDSMPIEGLWEKGWSGSNFAEEPARARKKTEADKARTERDAWEKAKAATAELEQKEKEIRAREKAARKQRIAEEKQAREHAKEEEKRREAEAEAAKKAQKKADPMSELDPELGSFILQQEKRWGKQVKKADATVQKDLEEKSE